MTYKMIPVPNSNPPKFNIVNTSNQVVDGDGNIALGMPPSYSYQDVLSKLKILNAPSKSESTPKTPNIPKESNPKESNPKESNPYTNPMPNWTNVGTTLDGRYIIQMQAEYSTNAVGVPVWLYKFRYVGSGPDPKNPTANPEIITPAGLGNKDKDRALQNAHKYIQEHPDQFKQLKMTDPTTGMVSEQYSRNQQTDQAVRDRNNSRTSNVYPNTAFQQGTGSAGVVNPPPPHPTIQELDDLGEKLKTGTISQQSVVDAAQPVVDAMNYRALPYDQIGLEFQQQALQRGLDRSAGYREWLKQNSGVDTRRTPEMLRSEHFARLADRLNNAAYYRPGAWFAGAGQAMQGHGPEIYQQPGIQTEDQRQQELSRNLWSQKATYDELDRMRIADQGAQALSQAVLGNQTALENLRMIQPHQIAQMIRTNAESLVNTFAQAEPQSYARLRAASDATKIALHNVIYLYTQWRDNPLVRTNQRAQLQLMEEIGIKDPNFFQQILQMLSPYFNQANQWLGDSIGSLINKDGTPRVIPGVNGDSYQIIDGKVVKVE